MWNILSSSSILIFVSPSIGLTNLAKPYHVHYHLSQSDMAGLSQADKSSQTTSCPLPSESAWYGWSLRLRRGATCRAATSVQRLALLADVRGNKACSNFCLSYFTPQQYGVREGDFIVGVNDINVKWHRHEKVVQLILASQSLKLQLITPLNQDLIHPQDHRRSQEISYQSSHSSVSSNGTMSPGSTIDRGLSPMRRDSPGMNGNESTTLPGRGQKKKNKVKPPDRASTMENRKSKKAGMLNSKAGLW